MGKKKSTDRAVAAAAPESGNVFGADPHKRTVTASVLDERGGSPFWDGVAGRFFGMTFQEADYFNAINGNQFIADLMPKHPVYVAMLSDSARAASPEKLETRDCTRPSTITNMLSPGSPSRHRIVPAS